MILLLLGLALGSAVSVGCCVLVSKLRREVPSEPDLFIDRLLSEAECASPSIIRKNNYGREHGVVVEVGRLKLIAGTHEYPPELEYVHGIIPLTEEQQVRVRCIVMDKVTDQLSTTLTEHLLEEATL